MVVVAAGRLKRHSVALAGLTAYLAMTVSTVLHHEPWADEAQAWLLARDAGLWELWTKLLHYEGSPGLWHTLLHVLVGVGLPYAALGFISALLGAVACWLVIRYAPWPLAIRVLLPFTFFLGYQYAVVARNYSLLPPLVFLCALLYPAAAKRIWLFLGLLIAIAAVSVHGMLLALAIWTGWLIQGGARDWRRLIGPSIVLLTVTALIAWSAWPSPDQVFFARPHFSWEHFLQISGTQLREAFTGNWALTIAVLALSLRLLHRGGGLITFAISFLLLSVLAAVVYAQVWHQGVVLLAWLFSMWISSARAAADPYAKLAFAIVILVQGYWTWRTASFDWTSSYSGSGAAAAALRAEGIAGKRVVAIGYACTGIQPYFTRNPFLNVQAGGPRGYWDWSSRNHVNRDSEDLGQLAPDLVIVGYKNAFERGVWEKSVQSGGYHLARHFEGNLFWHDHVLEPDSFDLYRRGISRP